MRRWLGVAGWALAAAWPFTGTLFGGRVLYFRDVCVTYFPDLEFVYRALRQGVWPLWHPGVDAGAAFLACYPVHLALLLVAGPRATLAVSPWLHVFVAMAGAGALARRIGISAAGSWVSGAVYGLSGLMLGSVLYPVFLAAAWAPSAAALFLSVVESPTGARVAGLALVLALQVSTLGAEVLPQTAILALALVPRRPPGRALLALAGALGLAVLIAAPALAGALWLLRGTSRGAGFEPGVALSYSAPLPVLLESLLPAFLGDPHTFSDAGFWGQPFFGGGTPFYLSLYLGPVALLLAAGAGRREFRLWALVALGLLLAAGAHGPLAPLLPPLMQVLRAPVKFFLLVTVAVALLAGRGLDRGSYRRRPAAFLPGALLLAGAVTAWLAPGAVAKAVGSFIATGGGPLARDVIATRWPLEWALTGALALGAGLALMRGGRLALLAGLLAVLDLARVNVGLNAGADGFFYDLRPSVAHVVESARQQGRYRWFSYGVALSPPLSWDPAIVRRNSDVWLFYMDRQSLLQRTQVLDGLEGAFDLDRMGLAPRGSTLDLDEARPELYRAHHARLRAANVRWVLSFATLPADLVAERAQVRFPEIREPLRLYELNRPLPRAYFASSLGPGLAEPDPGPERWSVQYETLDAHTVSLRCRTPPGFIVVLDGFHPDWTAYDGVTPISLIQVNGRYRALPTPGGERVFTLHFRPRWLVPALAACAVGLVITVGLLAAGSVSLFTGRGPGSVLDSAGLKGVEVPLRGGCERLTRLRQSVSIRRLNSCESGIFHG